MTEPKRIQRKRTKGWRMPRGAIYVGRPTIWGNPFWDVRRYGLDLCLRAYENMVQGIWNPRIVPEGPLQESWLRWIYEDHCLWRKRIDGHPLEVMRHELRGKDLACWCALDVPCHADILLRLANG